MPPELLLLAQICTKSFVGWGFAPDLTGGAYSTPPDSLVGIGVGVGPRGKGRREGGGKEGREWREGEGRGESPGMPKSRVGKPTTTITTTTTRDHDDIFRPVPCNQSKLQPTYTVYTHCEDVNFELATEETPCLTRPILSQTIKNVSIK